MLLTETMGYPELIIPLAPTEWDFDDSQEKMQMGEGAGSTTKREFAKMKQAPEASDLTVF